MYLILCTLLYASYNPIEQFMRREEEEQWWGFCQANKNGDNSLPVDPHKNTTKGWTLEGKKVIPEERSDMLKGIVGKEIG